MKKSLAIVFSSAIMLSLAGCDSMSNQDVGVVTGGVVGGAVGSLFGSGSGKILAAVGGTVVGAMIGGSIGHSMDRQDQMQMQAAFNEGQASRWQNPDGDEYYVEPSPIHYRGRQPCREFTTRAVIGGRHQTVYGTACRMADGSWREVQG